MYPKRTISDARSLLLLFMSFDLVWDFYYQFGLGLVLIF